MLSCASQISYEIQICWDVQMWFGCKSQMLGAANPRTLQIADVGSCTLPRIPGFRDFPDFGLRAPPIFDRWGPSNRYIIRLRDVGRCTLFAGNQRQHNFGCTRNYTAPPRGISKSILFSPSHLPYLWNRVFLTKITFFGDFTTGNLGFPDFVIWGFFYPWFTARIELFLCVLQGNGTVKKGYFRDPGPPGQIPEIPDFCLSDKNILFVT